jgi:hypothetical protein
MSRRKKDTGPIMMYYGHLPHFLLIECAFVTQHGWLEQEEDYCKVYFLKVRGDHQRLTPNKLWELWEKEADVALKAKAEGRIVELYKVVGQRLAFLLL